MRQARRRSCGRFFGLHFPRSRLPEVPSEAGRCLKNQCLDSLHFSSCKAGTVFHGGIRFPQFLTFVLPALFVAAPQADGRFQTAAAGCRSTGLRPSEDLSELPPLRSVVAGQVYHYRLAGSSQSSLPRLLPAGWVPLVTLLGRLYAEVRSSAQVVFAHPPDCFTLVGFCQLMYC